MKNKPKYDFTLMADFGGAWGWEDGACCNELFACDARIKIVSPVLLKAIEKWQEEFERYAFDDNNKMDWDKFNKDGIRLAKLLKKQVGHLYNQFYYDFAFEDKDFEKVYQKVRVEIL